MLALKVAVQLTVSININKKGRCSMNKALAVLKSAVCAFALAGMVFFAGCGGGDKSGGGAYNLKVSVEPADGGTIEIEPLSSSYPEWAKVEVTAKENMGFLFEAWSGEDASTSPQTIITMSGKKNKTLTANFKKVPAFVDNRDGKTYKKTVIGTQTWMAENLNYNASGSKCYGYGNNANYCDEYGRLYNWSTAKEACPAGWHLPSDAEWTTLANYVGGSSTAGRKLKSKTGWGDNGNGTDDYGFSALPGGFGESGDFRGAGASGQWWSATEKGTGSAFARDMFYIGDKIDGGATSKKAMFSVRCLLD